VTRLLALARRALLAAAVLAAFSSSAAAQPAVRLDVTITPVTVTFPLSDPDTVPIVSATPIQITYRIRQQNNNAPWTMTVLANGDLIAGSATVDISNVTWVATPAPPFQNGVLSKTVAQRLASGTGTVNPARQGQVTFRLANSWTYDAGLYTQTIVFTLTTP
jgi:hypothetical protein